MTPDKIHDYEYELRNATERLDRDVLVRAADRKLIQAFLRHIKAQDVSTGRLAKYTNMLHTASTLIRVPWSQSRFTLGWRRTWSRRPSWGRTSS
jgi:hypothetical protein